MSVRVDGAADAERACRALELCGDICPRELELALLTPECASAVEVAACEEHAAPMPSYQDVCFPPCPWSQAHYCNEDQNTTSCQPLGSATSRWITYSCDRLCAHTDERLVWARTCTNFDGGCECVPADAIGGSLPDGVSVREADAADADRACDAVETCGETCPSELRSGLLTEACVSAIEAAACEEHGQEAPGYHDTCFPRCELEASYCSEDGHRTVCRSFGDALRWSTLSCERRCATDGFEWTGACELNGHCDCVPATSSERR